MNILNYKKFMKKYILFLTLFVIACNSDIEQNHIQKFQKNLIDSEQHTPISE